MGTNRLSVYNSALMLCGERSLGSLSEDREPRRLLDQVWSGTAGGGGNGVDWCLEQGQWWFAMRTVMIDKDPDFTRQFGYVNSFDKPTDWIATSALCSDEYFRMPLINYADERDAWYADITPIYVKYISNDAAYGNDLSRWPATFQDFVATYLASRIISKMAGDRTAQQGVIMGPPGQPEKGLLMINMHRARSNAAMTQPTQMIAQGRWTRARQGTRGGRNDRGNPGSLIG